MPTRFQWYVLKPLSIHDKKDSTNKLHLNITLTCQLSTLFSLEVQACKYVDRNGVPRVLTFITQYFYLMRHQTGPSPPDLIHDNRWNLPPTRMHNTRQALPPACIHDTRQALPSELIHDTIQYQTEPPTCPYYIFYTCIKPQKDAFKYYTYLLTSYFIFA